MMLDSFGVRSSCFGDAAAECSRAAVRLAVLTGGCWTAAAAADSSADAAAADEQRELHDVDGGDDGDGGQPRQRHCADGDALQVPRSTWAGFRSVDISVGCCSE